MEGNPLLRKDAFQNEHSRTLFDAIEKLRSCSVNQDLELPELVIVGDQSAGKSSLLQSLTDIPFPVANNTCTRFPTRIISRRDPKQRETTTMVSIERKLFSLFGNTEDVKQRHPQMDGFNRSFSTMTKEDFARVIEDATDTIGISRATPADENIMPPDTKRKQNFSDHELKIVISGPDRSHFSILDVPGIFHSSTRRLTGSDKNGVDTMVAEYMKRRQSIIICVASGTSDIPTQAIFEIVKIHDPELERTVGVITKCDVAEQREDTIIEDAKNQEIQLRHGWFVVRNRTPSEVEEAIGPLERCSREQEFFNRPPWTQLPEERRGTEALKNYLAELLCDRIEKVFPTILNDIETRRNSTALELEALGIARTSVEQRRGYLTKIAHDLTQLATQGLRGRYDGVARHDMKLRMKVRDANDQFASEMNRNGHFLAFDLGPIGLNAQAGKVRPHYPGSQIMAFQAHVEKDNEGNDNFFQSISAMESYKDRSFEELRLSHYSQAQPPLLAKPNENSSGSTFQFGFGDQAQVGSKAQQSKTTTAGLNSVFPSASRSPSPSGGNSIFQTEPTEIYQWIRSEIRTCRGTELQGTMNTDVLPVLFHKQASKWREISGSHFENITNIAYNATSQVLDAVCKDPLTKKKIASCIREVTARSKDRFSAVLSQRVDHVLSSHLQTNNPAFERKVSEARKRRFKAALERYKLSKTRQPVANAQPLGNTMSNGFGGFGITQAPFGSTQTPSAKALPNTNSSDGSDEDPNRLVIDMRDVGALFAELHMSNSQNLEDEVHDTLKAYYEIARDDFIEYVNQLIVEPYLSDSEGPVLFFSPVYVAGLKDEDIRALGEEDEKNVRERAVKEATLARLNQAEKIAREYDQG